VMLWFLLVFPLSFLASSFLWPISPLSIKAGRPDLAYSHCTYSSFPSFSPLIPATVYDIYAPQKLPMATCRTVVFEGTFFSCLSPKDTALSAKVFFFRPLLVTLFLLVCAARGTSAPYSLPPYACVSRPVPKGAPFSYMYSYDLRDFSSR